MSQTPPQELSLEFDSSAWTRFGRLPADEFRRVQTELQTIVAGRSAELLARAAAAAPIELEVAGIAVSCAVDVGRNVLKVLDVVIPDSGPPAIDKFSVRVTTRVFMPRSARAVLDVLNPVDRMELETHLENLALMVSAGEFRAAMAAFKMEGENYVSEPSRNVRVHFKVDPATRVVQVQRFEVTKPAR